MLVAGLATTLNTKGNMGAVIAFMGTAILLYVGLPVISGMITAMNSTITSTSHNATLSVLQPVYVALNSVLVSGYGIMGLSLLIIGVVTILGYFGWGKMFS
jgi:hypothetical protein